MCGPIFSDTFNMSPYLINEAGVRLKLFQSKHNFRLMSSVAGKKYKEIIVEVMLKADVVGIHSDILKSHARALKDTPATAIYPFNKTDVKTFAVPKGQYDMNLDDIFQGKIPNRLVLGMVCADGTETGELAVTNKICRSITGGY